MLIYLMSMEKQNKLESVHSLNFKIVIKRQIRGNPSLQRSKLLKPITCKTWYNLKKLRLSSERKVS